MVKRGCACACARVVMRVRQQGVLGAAIPCPPAAAPAHAQLHDAERWRRLAELSDELGFRRQAIYCWTKVGEARLWGVFFASWGAELVCFAAFRGPPSAAH